LTGAARIRYVTRFALINASRRKWILANLMADRRTAAELRSFTMRPFLLDRVSRLAAAVGGQYAELYTLQAAQYEVQAGPPDAVNLPVCVIT
jgi:hypothetical protein